MNNYMTVRCAPYLLLFLLIGAQKRLSPGGDASIPVVNEKQIIKELMSSTTWSNRLNWMTDSATPTDICCTQHCNNRASAT